MKNKQVHKVIWTMNDKQYQQYLDCFNPKFKKGYKIIEAEMLYREGKENLRRLAVLIMILGIGLIIYGLIRSL